MNRQDLQNYRRNLQYLDSKRDDIMTRRESLYKICTSYGENFGGSREVQDKIAEKLADIIDEEVKLLDETLKQLDKLKEISHRVEEIEDKDYRNILYFMYISEQKMNLTEVSNKIGKEYKHTCKLHGKALNKFDEICEKHDKKG